MGFCDAKESPGAFGPIIFSPVGKEEGQPPPPLRPPPVQPPPPPPFQCVSGEGALATGPGLRRSQALKGLRGLWLVHGYLQPRHCSPLGGHPRRQGKCSHFCFSPRPPGLHRRPPPLDAAGVTELAPPPPQQQGLCGYF